MPGSHCLPNHRHSACWGFKSCMHILLAYRTLRYVPSSKHRYSSQNHLFISSVIFFIVLSITTTRSVDFLRCYTFFFLFLFATFCCAHFYIAISSITCLAVVLECGLIGLWCAFGMLFECRAVQHRWDFPDILPMMLHYNLESPWTFHLWQIRPFCQAAPCDIFTFASSWQLQYIPLHMFSFKYIVPLLDQVSVKKRDCSGLLQPIVMDVLMLASLSDCKSPRHTTNDCKTFNCFFRHFSPHCLWLICLLTDETMAWFDNCMNAFDCITKLLGIDNLELLALCFSHPSRIRNCHSTVLTSILKHTVYTKFMENGVGWNKNICKLSCENFLRITVYPVP